MKDNGVIILSVHLVVVRVVTAKRKTWFSIMETDLTNGLLKSGGCDASL